jgi:hypothetical protein
MESVYRAGGRIAGPTVDERSIRIAVEPGDVGPHSARGGTGATGQMCSTTLDC